MRILLSGPPGALRGAVAQRLEEEGHAVQVVNGAAGGVAGNPPRGRGRPNGLSNGEAAEVREALRRARAVIHLTHGSAEPLPQQVRRALLPLADLLSLAGEAPSRVERLVVVSPGSVYGEGSYCCPVNGPVHPQWRKDEDLRARRWEHSCPICGEQLTPEPTAETHAAAPLSDSGALAYVQERLAMGWALERRIPVAALRYFELYGGETGSETVGSGGELVSRAIDGLPIEVPEDGAQSRDYVHLDDVTAAVSLATRAPLTAVLAVNVAGGVETSMLQFLAQVEQALGRTLRIRPTGRVSHGEPRHLFARTKNLKELGINSPMELREGLEKCIGNLVEARPKTSSGRKT